MDWPELQDRVDRAARTHLGEPITYTAPGGSPEVIRGVFDDAAEFAEVTNGVIVSSYAPVLGVRIADLAAPPVEAAAVVARGTNYIVLVVRAGVVGWAVLQLEEA